LILLAKTTCSAKKAERRHYELTTPHGDCKTSAKAVCHAVPYPTPPEQQEAQAAEIIQMLHHPRQAQLQAQ
jgi:hypothetical protein